MQRRRRPRAVTLTLPDAQQPYLVLDGTKYTLRNFSEEGIGLWMPSPAPFGLHKGNRISGDVVIENHIHPVQLEVVRATDRVVGLRIAHKSEELGTIFKKLMEPVYYAADLKVHQESGDEDPSTGYSRLWYTGLAGTELLVWFSGSYMIQSLHVCWLGKWVQRVQGQLPETGFLSDEKRRHGGSVVQEEELVIHTREPDTQLLHQAAQFLAAVPPPLPGNLLWQFLETGEPLYLPRSLVISPQTVTAS